MDVPVARHCGDCAAVICCVQVTKAFAYTDVVDVLMDSNTQLRIKYSHDHDFIYETEVAPFVVQELRTR